MFNTDDTFFDEEQFIRENLNFLLDEDDFFENSEDQYSPIHYSSYEDRHSVYGISPIRSLINETWSSSSYGSIPSPREIPSTSLGSYFNKKWVSPWSEAHSPNNWYSPNFCIEDIYFGQSVGNSENICNNKYITENLYKLWNYSCTGRRYNSTFNQNFSARHRLRYAPSVADTMRQFENSSCSNTNLANKMWPYSNVASVKTTNSFISKVIGQPLQYVDPHSDTTLLYDLVSTSSLSSTLTVDNYDTSLGVGVLVSPTSASSPISNLDETVNKYICPERNLGTYNLFNDPELAGLQSDFTSKQDVSVGRTSTPINQLPNEKETKVYDVACTPRTTHDVKQESNFHNKPQNMATHSEYITFEDFLKTIPENSKMTSVNLSQSSNSKQLEFCRFCYKNGELSHVYMSHIMKSPDGIITCPILRKYVCDICGATGDKAHTRRYCPHNTEQNKNKKHSFFRRLTNGVLTSSHNHK